MSVPQLNKLKRKRKKMCQWFQLSSNCVPYFIKPSLSVLTSADVAIPGSKVNGTQTVKIRFCFNRRNSIQIQYTYAFWMSSHRLIKKSRAIAFPIGLFATLLKTVLTSDLKMPEVGSSNISSNLYFFFNLNCLIDPVDFFHLLFTQRVQWLAYWHTWPQGSWCPTLFCTGWKQNRIRPGRHTRWPSAGSLTFHWVKRFFKLKIFVSTLIISS